MDELFRFRVLRSAQSADENRTIQLTLSSALQKVLSNAYKQELDHLSAGQHESKHVSIKESASQGFKWGQIVKSVDSLHYGSDYPQLRKMIEETSLQVTRAKFQELVQMTFKMDAAQLVEQINFSRDKESVFDSIVLLMLSYKESFARLLQDLTKVAQVIGLLIRLAKNDPNLDKPGFIRDALTFTLVLPTDIFPKRLGMIQPTGVLDLIIVKQHIKEYEQGEISYIENILLGETKKRVVKHALSTEQIYVTETETTREEQKDLQSTERFELKNEVDKVVKEDTNIKSSGSVSYKYGDVLQIKASVDVAYDKAKEDAVKESANYSKDVVQRASTKVTERVRTQQTQRINEIFEEIDEHGVDNTDGTGHIIGIYQWLNKVYEAQMFNYGRHEIFDIMIPEPGALLLETIASYQAKQRLPEKPLPFLIKPNELTETPDTTVINGQPVPTDYFSYVKQYAATNVTSPPPETIIVSRALTDKGKESDDQNDQLVKDFEVPIPTGYITSRNIKSSVTVLFNWKHSSKGAQVVVTVGTYKVGIPNQTGTRHDFTLKGEDSKVAVSVETKNVVDYSLNLEIACERTDAALMDWKLKTYGAILQAYIQAQATYEEKLTALAFQQGDQNQPILGGNPDQNRLIERKELKRACIELLVRQYLNMNAITDYTTPGSTNKFPEPNIQLTTAPDGSITTIAEEQGNYARFFEQAFEWENLSYVLYPYYWGRRKNWYDRILLKNDDPLFADFLQAGVARVVVPVRNTFEDDIDFFLMTGQIWSGGEVPNIKQKDYLPISDEIRELSGAPGTEKPYGDPWKITLPTALVKLRKDSHLPVWQHDQSWNWTLANPDNQDNKGDEALQPHQPAKPSQHR